MRYRMQAVAAISALALSSISFTELRGQSEAVQVGEDVSPQAGLLFFSGGPVRGKRARTQTTPSTINETSTWVSLPNASLPYVVPAGTSDLFNVAFSAEGRLSNGGVDDFVRIRVIDTVGGVSNPLEPYDGDQRFFHAAGFATYKGNWVRRANAGSHTLQVQVWVVDGAPLEIVSATIDDWTFELVVYD